MPLLTEREARHPLASRNGLTLLFAGMVEAGSMCGACGFGTRATSKRWAACKNPGCGKRRIPRKSIENAYSAIEERIERAIEHEWTKDEVYAPKEPA